MIHIVLPYPEADRSMLIWATDEKKINFRKETEKANRCTLSYAGSELLEYFKKLGFFVSFSDKKEENKTNIFLSCGNEDTVNCDYTIEAKDGDVYIHGKSRVGALYGAYQLLKLQGVKWLNPEDEIVPEKAERIVLPDKKIEYTPSMPLGRGFDFEGLLKDSTKLWKWMARNGMNLSCYRAYTASFQKKLGMQFKMGGHVFNDIVSPDKVLPSGKTIWEEHSEWYGFDPDKERTKENAVWTQLCMSNDELVKFISDGFIEFIKNEWYEADRIDVWPFDTWGRSCQCENCKKLGNGSDRTLHLLSGLRARVDEAVKTGELDRNVGLILCSYEGTDTIEPPVNPVPENLRSGKDYVVFYPILRCYAHKFSDPDCSINSFYDRCLKGWKDIPVMVGEYYNVSKFEDLPLVFTRTMTDDLRYYHSIGVSGMTYMHIPMLEWGVRNLTQNIYSALCCDMDTDINALTENYFKDRYGIYSEQMKDAYSALEDAFTYITSWRSFRNDCVLIKMRYWDGTKPEEPFPYDDHLDGKAIEEGEKSVKKLDEAVEILENVRKTHFDRFAETYVASLKEAVNPVDLLKRRTDILGRRLNEDIRLSKYGRDMMYLELLFVKYYEALYKDENTDEIWTELDKTFYKMTDGYMPLTYVNSMENIELCCRDMIERSQFKEQYFKCKKYRIKAGLPV